VALGPDGKEIVAPGQAPAVGTPKWTLNVEGKLVPVNTEEELLTLAQKGVGAEKRFQDLHAQEETLTQREARVQRLEDLDDLLVGDPAFRQIIDREYRKVSASGSGIPAAEGGDLEEDGQPATVGDVRRAVVAGVSTASETLQADMKVDQQIRDFRSQHRDVDVDKVILFAADGGHANLEDAYKLMTYDEKMKAERDAGKKEVVDGINKNRGMGEVHGGAPPPPEPAGGEIKPKRGGFNVDEVAQAALKDLHDGTLLEGGSGWKKEV
jgi:hypothetical protein